MRVKNSLGTSPYQLVYGLQPIFPMNLKIPILRFMDQYVEGEDWVQIHLMNLLNLEEKQTMALEHVAKHQAIVK